MARSTSAILLVLQHNVANATIMACCIKLIIGKQLFYPGPPLLSWLFEMDFNTTLHDTAFAMRLCHGSCFQAQPLNCSWVLITLQGCMGTVNVTLVAKFSFEKAKKWTKGQSHDQLSKTCFIPF